MPEPAPRVAHYVASSHWDREWYETFQGFRMRLVELIDHVCALQDAGRLGTFTLDGQAIPVRDYLEIRPERAGDLRARVADGRLRVGPWYVMPDGFLVGGESLVRNLQLGMAEARALGGTSTAGFICDIFGHTSQLPQIFSQLGLPTAYLWRGLDHEAGRTTWRWRAPDGSAVALWRFGVVGYCTLWKHVRTRAYVLDEAVPRLVEHVLDEAQRSGGAPLLLFDGPDHIAPHPTTAELIARANAGLAAHGWRIVPSDLDRHGAALTAWLAQAQPAELVGELRASGRDRTPGDEQVLLVGVLSSRIDLKQANAAGEDLLTRWAEPFAALAARAGVAPAADAAPYLAVAWRHLIENHPHDSICGCSIDQVHEDMRYRFAQSAQIASRVADRALAALAGAAAPRGLPAGCFAAAVFNPLAVDLDEVVEVDLPLPVDWPQRWNEPGSSEERFGLRLRDADGAVLPFQILRVQRDRKGWSLLPYRFPQGETRHLLSIAVRLRLPALGASVLIVEPAPPPARRPGSLVAGRAALANGRLRVAVDADGTLRLTDLASGAVRSGLLAFADDADLGDGWNHGVLLADAVHLSGAPAEVAVVEDGPESAALRLVHRLSLPAAYDAATQRRSRERAELRIEATVRLRAGADRVEVALTVDNTVRDHRLRVLLPSAVAGAASRGAQCWSDAAFDVVERPVALPEDALDRHEATLATRPQQAWTACGDGRHGLAVIARGCYEAAVLDDEARTIAVTLLRGFRRRVFSDDGDGGQVLGTHRFRLWLAPFAGALPRTRLCTLAHLQAAPPRLVAVEREPAGAATLPRRFGLVSVAGDAVATACLARGDETVLRLFNPAPEASTVRLTFATGPTTLRCETLAGDVDARLAVTSAGNTATFTLPAKRIASVVWR